MNENNKFYEDDELKIDLKELFYTIKKNIVAIALAGIIGGAAALLFTKLFITPMYTAENSMLVLATEKVVSASDLTLGNQLTNDYDVLITSRPVLDSVIKELGLDTTYTKLKKKITITKPNDARILVLEVENADPQLAYDIVRAVADEAAEFIAEMMEVKKPKIIDYGIVPTQKTSPSTATNTIIGAFMGVVLVGGFLVLQTILDDTIKSEEDIEKYLGLSTLSSVPDRKDYIDQKNKKNKSKLAKFFKKSKKEGK